MIQPCRNPELMILTTTLNCLEKDPGKDCTEQSCLFRSRGGELNKPKYLVIVYYYSYLFTVYLMSIMVLVWGM